jgi:hypothetical protein
MKSSRGSGFSQTSNKSTMTVQGKANTIGNHLLTNLYRLNALAKAKKYSQILSNAPSL